MKRDESVYLQHILDAIARTEEYLQGVRDPTFKQPPLIQDGVIRHIEIIGEATRRLSGGCAQGTRTFLGTILPACATS